VKEKSGTVKNKPFQGKNVAQDLQDGSQSGSTFEDRIKYLGG